VKAQCLAAAALFLLVTGSAGAHTALSASVPASAAKIPAPREVVLEFAGEVRLTALVLTGADGKVRATDAVPTAPGTRFVVGVGDALSPGEYTIAWRAVSADTHILSGEIPFAVLAP
jgi:methionine-rich copper-binding protein CopC